MGLQELCDRKIAKQTGDAQVDKEFLMARRPTYLKVHLDSIINNLKIIRSRIASHTEIMAVVKANAYGHGSIPVSRFLQKQGIRHFAVATALEGEELRQAGISGMILVLGNASTEEIPTLCDNDLTPTVATTEFVSQWAEYLQECKHAQKIRRSVVIKIDTGLSRNGCKPEYLNELVKVCDDNEVPIHSMMTHFAQSWDDYYFTKQQLELFIKTVTPYRDRGIKLHVANSGAINNNIGVDLDYVRPGISMYGQPPDTSSNNVSLSESMGYCPAISWIARPTLVKELQPGDVVGYDKTYKCKTKETIATFPVGYADGYHRNMFEKGHLTTSSGIKCPVVGRVSMDSITVRLPDDLGDVRTFYLMTSDTNDTNSSLAISRIGNTIPYEVCTDLHRRVPRLYLSDGILMRAITL